MNRAIVGAVALCSILGCTAAEPERVIRVSETFQICAKLPRGSRRVSPPRKAHDFEVTELTLDGVRTTIYVGDFPDYPGFRPDRKFHEPQGEVHYLGKADRAGIRGYLYRVGLGRVPSVHVLTQMPVAAGAANSAWERNEKQRIDRCE